MIKLNVHIIIGICGNLIMVRDTRLFYVARDKNVPRISILTVFVAAETR